MRIGTTAMRKSRRPLASVRRRAFSPREDLAPPVWPGEGTKANHLTYPGDIEIGTGSIICNYDGLAKRRTAFVGSDSIRVAPVSIGDGVMVTAGSVITGDEPPPFTPRAASRTDRGTAPCVV
jgi:hypothetical protein